jgi:hypothetical protein
MEKPWSDAMSNLLLVKQSESKMVPAKNTNGDTRI